MTSTLPELDYSVPSSGDASIATKREVRLQSPASSHGPTSNSTIRFTINSANFLEPESVGIWANLTFSAGTGNQVLFPGTETLANANSGVWLPSMSQLVSSVRILTGTGVLIENITDAGLLHTLMVDSSSSESYQDKNYDITTNGNSRPCRRHPTGNFRMGVLDLSGLLHCGKLIHLGSINGLVIELDLAPVNNVVGHRVAPAGDNVLTYALTNVECRFTDVVVSDSVRINYENKVFGNSNGYALLIQTPTTVSSVTTANVQSVPLPKRAGKVKHILSCIRATADITDATKWGFARLSAGFNSYQYQINGATYPPSGVDSYSKAYTELLKTSYNHGNCLYSGLSFAEYQTALVLSPLIGGLESNDRFNSKFIMSIDLEKQNGVLSGTAMTGQGDSFSYDFAAGASAGTCTSFIYHERVVSISATGVDIFD
jgi:hypothetical protein